MFYFSSNLYLRNASNEIHSVREIYFVAYKLDHSLSLNDCENEKFINVYREKNVKITQLSRTSKFVYNRTVLQFLNRIFSLIRTQSRKIL